MAKAKTKDEPNVQSEENEVIEPQELNLDAKVTVRSIADWDTGFSRIVEGIGDITIPPHGVVRITRNEIIAQVQSGNVGFTGFDGRGSHATYYIEDAATRREVGFESPDGKVKQQIFSEDLVKKLFAIKNQAEFEQAFIDSIKTRAEKTAIMPVIKKLGINDYQKIRFVEDYAGFKI